MSAPQHSLDAPAVYVFHNDPAWDMDRIDRERGQLDNPYEHPYSVYLRGETRFDLDAPIKWSGGSNAVREYLTGEPVAFTLRRLTVAEQTKIQAMISREMKAHGDSCSFYEVYEKAAWFGVQQIEGDQVLDTPLGGRLTEAKKQAIVTRFGDIGAISALGDAVVTLYRGLSEAEKKRSGY